MRKGIIFCVGTILTVAFAVFLFLEFYNGQAFSEPRDMSRQDMASETVIADPPGKDAWLKTTEIDSLSDKKEAVDISQQDKNAGVGTCVSYSYDDVNMSIDIPSDWEYEIREYSTETESCSIYFWPADRNEGKLEFQYSKFFGVCGTGLSEEKISIGKYEAYKGTYDDDKVWRFISLITEPGKYVIWRHGAVAWPEEYMDEAMEIINSICVGADAVDK